MSTSQAPLGRGVQSQFVTTAFDIDGYEVVRNLGVVRGITVRSRSIFGTGRTAATLSSTVKSGFMEWSYSGVKENRDLRVKDLMGCAKCHLPQLADAGVLEFLEFQAGGLESLEEHLGLKTYGAQGHDKTKHVLALPPIRQLKADLQRYRLDTAQDRIGLGLGYSF